MKSLLISRVKIAAVCFGLVTACSAGIAGTSFYDPAKYHHTPDGFRNPKGSFEREIDPFRFAGFIYRRLTYDFDPAILPAGHVLEKSEIRKQFAAAPEDARITWIGHATFLIGLDGLNILTDPFFSDRASPVTFLGPRRFMPPGITIEDLPKIDIILISHNHYDSLDEEGLDRLARHSPDATVLVPLGLVPFIKERGFKHIRQMDWYDVEKFRTLTVQSTPSIHRSNRGTFDVNQSLWSGFVISAPVGGQPRKIWFVGDTGLGPVFEEDVAKKAGPVDIALVPIGAYLPRDIMRPVHTTPAEALRIARIMGAKIAIAMHWGTLPLGEDLPFDAKSGFEAAQAPGVAKVLMKIGETRDMEQLLNR